MLAADFSVEFLEEARPTDWAFAPAVIASDRVATDLRRIALPSNDWNLRELNNTPLMPNEGALGGLLELDSSNAEFHQRINLNPVAEAWQFDSSTIADIEQNSRATSSAVERDDEQEPTECQSCEGGLIVVVTSTLPSSVARQTVDAVPIVVDPIMGHARNVELADTPGHDAHEQSLSPTTLVSLNINSLSMRQDRGYSAMDMGEVSGPLRDSLCASLSLSTKSQSLDSGMSFDTHHFDPLGGSTDPKIPMKRVDERAAIRTMHRSTMVHAGLDASAAPCGDVAASCQLFAATGNNSTSEQASGDKLNQGNTLIQAGILEVELVNAERSAVSEVDYFDLQWGLLLVSGVLFSSSWYYRWVPVSRRYSAGDFPRQRLKALLNDDGDS